MFTSDFQQQQQQKPKTITMVVEGLSCSKSMSAERARDLMAMSEENFRNALSIIRQMCDEQIQQAARTQKWHTYFAVPHSLFGYEKYDKDKMGRLLAQSLYEDGFSVRGPPGMLEVIWGKKYTQPLTRKTLERYDAEQQKKKLQ